MTDKICIYNSNIRISELIFEKHENKEIIHSINLWNKIKVLYDN